MYGLMFLTYKYNMNHHSSVNGQYTKSSSKGKNVKYYQPVIVSDE